MKVTESIKLPLDVSRAVTSLCNDYDRREKALRENKLRPELRESYIALNSAIDEALTETCEEGIRLPMRRDIGLGRGHRMSPIYFVSEKTYKRRKRSAKAEIARRLGLF